MKWTAVAIAVLLLVFGLGGHLRAEQISWVTISSAAQADVAAAVTQPYLRDGNRFLVGLTPDQSDALIAGGLEVTPVLRDADPAATYRVMPNRHGDIRGTDLLSAGQTADLGNGSFLVEASSSAAASLSADPRYLVNALSDLSIRWLYLPPTVASSLAMITDFPTDTLAALVSQDSIYAYDQHLMDYQTRYIWSDSNAAARSWIVQKFLDWGYTDVSVQPFPYGGSTHYNIVCVKPGYAEPDKVIVVGGHYDSINSQSDPMVFAPGADDNGSGTTTTMEIARVLKDFPCRKTIIFMPFSAEEQGLIGSGYAAAQFAADSTDIEVMYNFDMVGYDPYDAREVSLGGASFNTHYSDLTGLCAARVTDLTPVPVSAPGGSDHQSFMQQGYPVVDAIEAEFNYGGWHTNSDITSRMNFPYFTKVVKTAVASLAVVANAAHPTEIAKLTDEGDGQSIEVYWSDCDPAYTYKLYWGQASGAYSDSMDIAPGACSQVIDGLTEGVRYYFSVIGTVAGGYPAVYAVEDTLTPLVVPRSPHALKATPVLDGIQLDWDDGPEADLRGYRVYRQIDGLSWGLYQDNVATSSFTDLAVSGQTRYNYRVTAVDFDGHESDYSLETGTWPATFDGGILVADEITQGTGVPTQDAQVAFWDTTFGETPFTIEQIEGAADSLRKGIAGQYSSIFWFDGDLSRKNLTLSNTNIDWYLRYNTNMLICGLRTVQFWGRQGDPYSDVAGLMFGLNTYSEIAAADFAGAHGQNGWPDVEVDQDNLFGLLPNIPMLVKNPDVQVIYTYDAASDDPTREGAPVGLLKHTVNGVANGYHILLAFPVTFLTDSTAALLISHAKELFGETATIEYAGDVDGSGTVNIADITYLVAFMFQGGPDPVSMNGADADGNCIISIADITYLVSSVFKGGPAPLPGCVE